MISKRDASAATFLRSVPVFQDLKGPNLEVLIGFLEERSWAVGEAICQEGELGRTLYVIREGEIEVLRSSSKGNPVPIVRLGPGECFGEMTLVELQPRSASCIVRKKAVTYALTNLDLWNLYKTDNFAYTIVLQNICRMLSRRLRKADSRIVEFIDALEEARKARLASKSREKLPQKSKATKSAKRRR